jgi:hypothetical protein
VSGFFPLCSTGIKVLVGSPVLADRKQVWMAVSEV